MARGTWTRHGALAVVAGLTVVRATAAQTPATPRYAYATAATSAVPDARTLRSTAGGDVASEPAPTARALAVVAMIGTMRSDLRNLIMAQEMYWSANHRYAASAADLAGFQAAPGVDIAIGHASADGWTARATSAGAAGRSCVIWAGPVAPGERPATDAERKTYPEAEVSCDGDGYRQQLEWAAAAQSYMTYALRSLERSEEKFRALNGAYAQDGDALEPFIWDRGVSVTILTATPTAWSARATFNGVTGRSCVLWRGDLPESAVPRTALQDHPGVRDEVVCDGL